MIDSDAMQLMDARRHVMDRPQRPSHIELAHQIDVLANVPLGLLEDQVIDSREKSESRNVNFTVTDTKYNAREPMPRAVLDEVPLEEIGGCQGVQGLGCIRLREGRRVIKDL